MKRLWLCGLALAVGATPALAQSNWRTYGGSDWSQRWSTLAQIKTGNVSRLVPRMIFQTGTSKLGSFENTPIVVDGKMYVTTPNSEAIIAYDLRTKRQLWRHEPKVGTIIACCGPVNRGSGRRRGNVFVGTLDGRAAGASTPERGSEVERGSGGSSPGLQYHHGAADRART